MRYFEGYRCSNCEKELPAGSRAGECPSCSSPLLCVYDTSLLGRDVTREEFFSADERSIWRFRRLLPDLSVEISLGEGCTPLMESERLGSAIGAENLYIKDESLNPTGSFKARGMAAAVSRLVDLGIREAHMPSAGNAALALAAYGAHAGIETNVFIPDSAPSGIAEECRAYGSRVEVIPGLLPDAASRMHDVMGDDQRGLVATFREPCRVEGKKTIAFEIEADTEGRGVDWILFPTGGGTGIVAIWKAYREMEELGWLRSSKPSLAVVQSAGCAPIVRAFERGDERVERWEDPETCACGICVPSSRADRLILEALTESGGAAVAVTDDRIMEAVGEMSRCEGIFPSPEGAATWAGLKELISSGKISPSSRIVLVNTAGGARYRFLYDAFTG
jgi:threonine synthase